MLIGLLVKQRNEIIWRRLEWTLELGKYQKFETHRRSWQQSSIALAFMEIIIIMCIPKVSGEFQALIVSTRRKWSARSVSPSPLQAGKILSVLWVEF